MKSPPSTSLVSTESVTATNLSFSPALENSTTNEEVSFKSKVINESHELMITQASIFVASQRGDVELLRELIESGKATATDRDPQNITPLHWAAINAHVAACRYLLEQGAEVDALGDRKSVV